MRAKAREETEMSGSVEHAEAKADRTEDVARAARVWSELTKGQRDALWWARKHTGSNECVGYGAKGAAVIACRALVKRGLCTYEGLCVDVDDHNKEGHTYAITAFGRLVADVGDRAGYPGYV